MDASRRRVVVSSATWPEALPTPDGPVTLEERDEAVATAALESAARICGPTHRSLWKPPTCPDTVTANRQLPSIRGTVVL
jgi:hypothetical protein